MKTIYCNHPSNKVIVKQDIERTTDVLIKRSKPYSYCTDCKSRLPIYDGPGRHMVTFFFIKQGKRVSAEVMA